MAEVAVLLSVGRHPASGRARRAELDARALELALTQCEGERIHAIHAGDPDEPALREYLGMGIETLTVLDADGPLAEAAIIAHLKALRPAVIFCGAAAERGEGSGMLPYRLAEALGAHIVANAVAVAIRGDTARVAQALPRGARRALRMALPLVLTVDRAAPPARMSAYGPARRGRIEVHPHRLEGGSTTVPQSAPDAALERPARVRPRRLRTMGQGSAGDRLRSLTSIAAGGSRLEGLDPEQAAEAIWRYLQQEGLADSIGPDAAAARRRPTPKPLECRKGLCAIICRTRWRVCVKAAAAKRSVSRFGFLTLNNYSLIAFANALEPLRMANRVGQGNLYQWTVLTLDGQPALASNGLSVSPTKALADAGPMDVLFVCGGVEVREAVDPKHLAALREAARKGVALGGLCTGTWALARAGVVDGYRCAIHWENMSAIREEFPRTVFTPELFVIDRDRYTCSGGIAPIDLMLNLIHEQHGKELTTAICEQFILDRLRDSRDQQHIPLQAQVGAHNQILIKAATLMEANVEEPLPLEELAGYVGVSRRQLERLFKRYLGRVPTRYYLELRLRRARELLLQTDLSVMDITVACGFQSPPHFSKCYRGLFGYPPSMERRRARGGPHAVN